MTIRTKEPELPSQLPPARLFLDDIEEIVRILTELTESAKIPSHPPETAPQITVRFETGGEECDKPEDLPKIAKWHSEFQITVSRGVYDRTWLTFHSLLFTTWHKPSRTDEATWSAFRKLIAVFNKRKRKLPSLVYSLPWPLTSAIVFLLPYATISLIAKTSAKHPILVGCLLAAVILATALRALRYTVLVPRHSWEPSPVRQYFTEKLVPLVIAFVLGIVSTLILTYIKHKLWP